MYLFRSFIPPDGNVLQESFFLVNEFLQHCYFRDFIHPCLHFAVADSATKVGHSGHRLVVKFLFVILHFRCGYTGGFFETVLDVFQSQNCLELL